MKNMNVNMNMKSTFAQPRDDRLFIFIQTTDEKTFPKEGAKIG